MAGNVPPSSPNGYSTFTPEFDLSFETVNAADVTYLLLECEMTIETRG